MIEQQERAPADYTREVIRQSLRLGAPGLAEPAREAIVRSIMLKLEGNGLLGAPDRPPASSGKALTGKAQGAWSFDMEAAPWDGTNVIVAVASIHEGQEPIVGQAFIDADNGGHWWWAGTSYGDYYASPIHETNNPPYAWHPMLDAPAPPASSGQGGR